MKDVKIYTTSWCSYCKAAKRLLDEKGWNYQEINIEKKGWGREKLLAVGKGTSVPQIVVDGRPIGGYEDLIRLLT